MLAALARGNDNATEILPPGEDHVPPEGDPGSLIDRSLGKFTILERLGRGGSGEVFRAEQVQLGRSAVIKVLRRDVVNAPNRVDRFLREAKLASRLDHPYAAHIYAFGAEPDGLLWIAMEHVRGSTLDALVARRGPMPPALFGPLFARLCEVVHTAHELGIVHRDIKGSNVMVIERAGQLLPKLLDFGIAKGLDGLESPAAPGNSHELTGQGSTLGSPHYMAPEQWRSAADVDSRADVYALGVLAYFCVSGGLPFRDVERAGLAQAHMETPPPPLRSIPLAIADVIMRALAKSPDDRWASALSFGDAIRRAVGGIAPEAVPILDPATRDAWFRGGPQPIADAVARLARAATTVEADAALRELVAITCRWLGVLALSQLDPEGVYPDVRDHARALVGRDDGGPWIRLARVATNAVAEPLPGLVAALAGSPALELLADRLDDRERTRTAAGLTIDVSSLADALRPLEALLAYQLVVGRPSGAESWQGVRRRDRERVIVWGEPLPDGEVALLDGTGRKVATLSPLVQIIAPLPASEPELFLLWRTARGQARLVAAPWGFERDDAAAAQRLAILITEDADTLHDHAGDRSPYPGLAAYGLGDADRFVGREREIEALANRLVRSPLLAVLGPSGAGKSSFVHAGVLPRLAEHYEIVTMRPGRHPLHALAALPGVGTDAVDTAEIVQRLRLLGERAPRGLVVVIDQFEELVTLCTSAGERRRFAAVLAAAADGPSAPVRVVVTLRDDFATVLESEDAIRGRFDVFVLATPTPEALRRIVIEPARRAAVAVDARVVDDMVAEVAGRPASLPLLSFTAAQLWAARDRQARRITHDAYLELGGVAGALSTYADQVYGSLARRDQQIVRDLFSRLVASDGTRIPAPRSELEGIAGAQAVLAHLVDARLVVVREDEGVDIIEVVHECLAERWPRLARWRNEDAADRVLLGDVGAAARRWHDANRRADLLWRGEALAELRKLAARSNALTELERAFTDAAAGAEQRARRVRRILVGGAMAALAAIAIAMAYLGIAATRSRSEAETSAAAARDAAKLADDHLTKSLIAQGRRELNDGRAMAALAYFAEVMRRGGISPSVRFMVSIASRAWRYELEVRRTSDITELEVGGTWVVAGDGKGVLHWWTSDGKPSGDSQTGLDLITVLRRQPGDQLVAIGRRGVAVIDPKTRAVIHRIETKTQALLAHLGPAAGEIATIEGDGIHVYDLAGTPRRHLAMTARQAANEPRFSPTGSHVIVSGQEHAEVIDLVTLALRPIAKNLDGPLEGAADGSVVGYVDSDGLAHLLTATGTPIRTFRPANRPHTLIFSPTGDRVGALSDNGLVVHDANGKPLHGIPAVKSAFTQIEIRGDDVWLAPPDGTVQRYRRGVLIASLPSQLGEFAAFLVTKDLVLTAGNDGAFVMLRGDAEQLKLVPRPCETQSNSLAGVAVGYRCDETWHLFVGTREVASVADTAMGYLAYEPSSGRAAIGSKGAELVVYEAGKPIARASREHPGAFAFEDRGHVVVANSDDGAVSRWTIAADRWDRIATVPHASAIGRAGATLFVGTDTAMIGLRDGVESSRVATTAAVFALAATRDGRWVAAQLQNGATAIFDGATGALVRQLEPSDATGGGATFDLDGDLVIRPGRGSIQIYDRASGDPLIWSLDLLAESIAARFDDQGRIEVNTWEVGLLDIPIDRRPVADLIHDIDCKVPLRVVDARLGPAIPVCP